MCARYPHVKLASFLVLCLTATGCGGAEEEAAEEIAPVSGTTGAETSATAGTAGQGAACDYGGADAYTCAAGLECCYGEHARPDGYGTCQTECNWD